MTSKSPDQLTETTDEGKIELEENDLNRVSGGDPAAFLKYELKNVAITSHSVSASASGDSSGVPAGGSEEK